MSVCIKYSGMFAVSTFLLSVASMIHNITRVSSNTVGEIVSSLVMYLQYFLPSQHTRPLIIPPLFFFINIRYDRAAIISSRVGVFGFYGSRTFLSCRCSIYLSTASIQYFPNSFSPWFMPYCANASLAVWKCLGKSQ